MNRTLKRRRPWWPQPSRTLTEHGWQRDGIPAHGNQSSKWEAGCRFDFPNPEHR